MDPTSSLRAIQRELRPHKLEKRSSLIMEDVYTWEWPISVLWIEVWVVAAIVFAGLALVGSSGPPVNGHLTLLAALPELCNFFIQF